MTRPNIIACLLGLAVLFCGCQAPAPKKSHVPISVRTVPLPEVPAPKHLPLLARVPPGPRTLRLAWDQPETPIATNLIITVIESSGSIGNWQEVARVPYIVGSNSWPFTESQARQFFRVGNTMK